MKNIYAPTYNDMHNACLAFADVFERLDFNFEVVVGISRGGLIPGVILSHMLGIPFEPISYSSKSGAGEKQHKNFIPEIGGNIVLLVDEICDTGNTLKEVKTVLEEQQKKSVYTCCLYYKKFNIPLFVPDFRWITIPEDSPWVVFPYETKNEL
jgi:hypoxanthine phosphoribosyltransferase